MDEQSELPPFPIEGVKLKVFIDFIEDMGRRQVFFKTIFEKQKSKYWGICPCFSRSAIKTKQVPLTTTDVCDMLLKEVTKEEKSFYVEHLAGRGSPDVGRATVFMHDVCCFALEFVIAFC